MKVSGQWLERAETQKVCAALRDAGWQALPVGGCVRNALLGVPVADVDIATDARPETVSDLAKKAGFKVVPTGIEHGTVTVIAGGVPMRSPPSAATSKPMAAAPWWRSPTGWRMTLRDAISP